MNAEAKTKDPVREAALLACRQLLHAMRLADLVKPTPSQARMAVESMKLARSLAAKAVEQAERAEGKK